MKTSSSITLAVRIFKHIPSPSPTNSSDIVVQFTNDRRDDMNFMVPKPRTPQSSPGKTSLTVPVTTLFPALPRCDLLKIVVEGSELAVLRGAQSLLSRTHQILVEAGDPKSLRHGTTSSDLLTHLESAGFEMCATGRGEGCPRPD